MPIDSHEDIKVSTSPTTQELARKVMRKCVEEHRRGAPLQPAEEALLTGIADAIAILMPDPNRVPLGYLPHVPAGFPHTAGDGPLMPPKGTFKPDYER